MATLFQAIGGVIGTMQPGTSWAAPNGLFPTTSRNDSSAYSWSSSTSTVTLPSSGLADGYLFLWGYEFEDSSNGRLNPQGRMVQASGTGTFASAATGGYNRDNSEDRSYVSGWSFVDGPSASSTFQFQWKRDTDAPNTSDGTVRSFLQVVPLYYSDVGVYTSSSTTATGGTTPVQIGGFSGTDGTNITISSSQVSVTGDNKRYLCLGSAFHEGLGSSRTQRWYGFEIDGSFDDAAKSCVYYRSTTTDESGASFMRLLETATATRTIEINQYRGDGVGAGQGGADVDGTTTSTSSAHALVVIELNDSAEVFSSIDSTGGQEFALTGPVDVDIASTSDIEFNDSASFTRASDTGVNVESDMDVLAFANVSHAREASSIGSGTRWTVHGEFTINGAEQTSVGFHGNYNRGNQSSEDCMGSSCNNAAFFAVTSGQDVGVSNQELSGTEGGNGDIESQPGWVGFGLINLDSLEDAGGATHTASGTPSITSPTASGVAKLRRKATAAVAIAAVTALGTAGVSSTITASGTPSIEAPTASAEANLAPKVYLNTSQTLSGATEMVVTSWNTAGTSITFTDPAGPPIGSVYLGVENRGNSEVGWIAVTVTGGKTASGTPAISEITSSGSSSVGTTLTASGTPTAAEITSSALTNILSGSEGTPTVEEITASGVALLTHTASSSSAASEITATGQAKLTHFANSASALEQVTASGTAPIGYSVSGAPSMPQLVASGVSAKSGAKNASGDPSISEITASGVVLLTHIGDGSLSIPQLSSSGTANIGYTVTGSSLVPTITTTGVASAKEIITASGTPVLAGVVASGITGKAPKVYLNTSQSLSGATELTVTAWNAAGTSITFTDPLGPPTGSLYLGVENRNNGDVGWIAVTVSTTQKSATGSPELPEITASGTATSTSTVITSSGTPSITEITASGLTNVLFGSEASPEIPEITASANATVTTGGGKVASGTPSITEITASGLTNVLFGSEASPTLPEITSAANVTVTAGGPKTASGTPSIEAISSSGLTVVGTNVVATSAVAVGEITTTASAEIRHTASSAATIAEVTVSGLTNVLSGSEGSPTLSEIQSASTATLTHVATSAVTLSELTASAIAISSPVSLAIGSPALPEISGLGTTTVTPAPRVASGTPSLAEITAAGTVGRSSFSYATGAPELPEITASGQVLLNYIFTLDPDRAIVPAELRPSAVVPQEATTVFVAPDTSCADGEGEVPLSVTVPSSPMVAYVAPEVTSAIVPPEYRDPDVSDS